MQSRALRPPWKRRGLIHPPPNHSGRNRRNIRRTSPRPPRESEIPRPLPFTLMLSLSKHEGLTARQAQGEDSFFRDTARTRSQLRFVASLAVGTLLFTATAMAKTNGAEGTGRGGSGEAILIAEIVLLVFVGWGFGE